MGFVYMRSDWDGPDATWIAFWAGPHIDTHQHLDQGAFTIFKRRDLAPKTGHYDADNVKSSHDLAYYTRTVSSNNILVGDPHEVFRNFIAGMGCDANGKGDRIKSPDGKENLCIPNDGGQRTFTPGGMAVHDGAYFNENRDDFDVAKVVAFQDDGQAVTIAADITNAYSNPRYSAPPNTPKVTRVWRRLVYLRKADLLLVADTVESTNPNFEKKWLLHALDRVDVGGQVQKIDAGESVHTGVDTARIVVDDADRSDAAPDHVRLAQRLCGAAGEDGLPGAFPLSGDRRARPGRYAGHGLVRHRQECAALSSAHQGFLGEGFQRGRAAGAQIGELGAGFSARVVCGGATFRCTVPDTVAGGWRWSRNRLRRWITS